MVTDALPPERAQVDIDGLANDISQYVLQTQFLQTRRFGDLIRDQMDCWFTSQAGLIKHYPYQYQPDYHTFQYPEAFRDRKDPCNWVPTRDGLGIEWFYNRRWHEKGVISFDDALFWIQWIADNILKPWGMTLEGDVWYQGGKPETPPFR